MAEFSGRGVVVIGASTGIGRAVAVRAVRAGAEVVMTARRQHLLEEAIEEAGGGHAVVADLSTEEGAASIAAAAREHLPQLDLVTIFAGTAPLIPLEETSHEKWTSTLATNVVGVNRCIAALSPEMAPGGIVAACSSESVGNPRWGLGAYAASKAALEESIRAWRNERPGVRFTCLAVGATMPTDFGSGFEEATLLRAFEQWAASGLAQMEMMHTDEVAKVIVDIFSGVLPHPGICIDDFMLRSPSATVAEADAIRDGARKNQS